MKTSFMKLAILNLFSPSVLATDNLQNRYFLEFVFFSILISHFGDISPVKKMAGVPAVGGKTNRVVQIKISE
jgi:hypothetical protein